MKSTDTMQIGWDTFLDFVEAISAVLTRDLSSSSSILEAYSEFPVLHSGEFKKARGDPKTGIGNPSRRKNGDFACLPIQTNDGSVMLFLSCHVKDENPGDIVAQIIVAFIESGDDGPKSATAIRFETPSCWDFGKRGKDGEHDFFHAQFCQRLFRDQPDKVEFRLPKAMKESWPTIPLQARNAAELLWTSMIVILGRKQATNMFGKQVVDAAPKLAERLKVLTDYI